MVEIEQKKSAGLLPWMYIIMLYVTTAFPIVMPQQLPEDSSSTTLYIFIALGVITCILGVVNCIMAWVNCRRNRENHLCGCVVLMKYATIPFHLCCAVVIFASSVIFVFGGFVFMILAMILQACVFIVSICYAWSYLVVTVMNGKRGKGMAVLHGILLAIYVVDVADTIIIMLKQKKHIIASLFVLISIVIALVYIGLHAVR